MMHAPRVSHYQWCPSREWLRDIRPLIVARGSGWVSRGGEVTFSHFAPLVKLSDAHGDGECRERYREIE
jgi:hypothetical protein